MKIGLYFGSFNPIHIGHMMLANYIVEFGEVDEVWFVVSPQNPFKERRTLLDENFRYDIVYEAIKDESRFKVSNIEFGLNKPSFTSDTLVALCEKFPFHEFTLIMGEDNLTSFKKWKNVDYILKNYEILVYPRHGEMKNELINHPKVTLIDAPKIEISSSFIRKAIKDKKDVSWFLPANAWELIDKAGYYL